MNTKTTAILTFIVTVVVPFIQEVADFFNALSTGSTKSSAADAIRAVGFEVTQDLQNSAQVDKAIEDYNLQTVGVKKDTTKESAWSRFFKDRR